MRNYVTISALVLLLVLTGCRTVGEPVEGGGDAGFTFTDDNPIQWQRTADTVVFRADVVGDATAEDFLARNDVPPCTIYGDNRIVWLPGGDADDRSVFWDVLTDEEIREFVEYLVFEEDFYSYQYPRPDVTPIPQPVIDPTEAARLINLNDDVSNPDGLDRQPALDTPEPTVTPLPTRVPFEPGTKPIVEELQLNISGEDVLIDAFSQWGEDFYPRIQAACSSISDTPVTFAPSGAWLSAQAIEYDPNLAIEIWDAAATGVSLQAVAEGGERVWVDQAWVPDLWNVMRNSPGRIMYLEGDGQYQIALEVPNVTRYAPQPPEA